MKEGSVSAAVIVAEDHWTGPGGRTLEALEQMVEGRTGQPYRITELLIVSSVEHMRSICFPDLN